MSDSETTRRMAIEVIRLEAATRRLYLMEPLAEALEDIANAAESWLEPPVETSETP